jgi:NAD(P) transhydrogenase
MRTFDLCVIGSGAAGQKAAIQAAKLGKSVVVVEARDVVGGAAVNTGTIPSKALREAILNIGGSPGISPTTAEFASAAKNVTMSSLWQSCNRVISAEVEMVKTHFASNGITLLHGFAKFKDANTIDVCGQHFTESINAQHILIAVGTSPSKPANIEFDETDIMTSDELLRLQTLPKSMIVVGGGVIGTEYASMLASLGVKVTLIEGRNRLLDFVDAELTEALQYHLRQRGITLRMGEKVVKITKVPAPEGVKSDNALMA